jgi:Zn-dependent protease with chaperone function
MSTTADRERFERLARRAEALVASQPRAYRVRVVLWALLGYAVLLGTVFALLALVVGSVWGALASTTVLVLLLKNKLIVPVLALAYVILRALWVRLEPPSGHVLERGAFPRLYAVIDGLRQQVRALPIHQVLLTEDFNAAVTQTPRLGVLGWPRNTLLLGLPLLMALSPEQARAVLAHELGHLSRSHGRLGGWVHRVRVSWYRIMEAFGRAQYWGGRWLARFFAWYAPAFDAYSFALARANEYEADALSARLTSAEAAGEALVQARLRSELASEHYWGRLEGRVEREPDPLPDAFSGLARFFRDPAYADPALAAQVLTRAAETGTEGADTHPALGDRLAALGTAAVVPAPASPSAAEEWLGPEYPEVLARFDSGWAERNRAGWQERHHAVQEARARLAGLRSRDSATLAPLERWELAALTEQLDPETDPLPLFRDYQAAAPDDPDADFVIGRLLLTRNDPAGVAAMERAMRRFSLGVAACGHVCAYYRRTGEPALSAQWRRRGEELQDLAEKARAERELLSPRDPLVETRLGQEWVERLREQLARIPGLRAAWICEKQVRHLPEEPVYVVAVQPRNWLADEVRLSRRVAEAVELPGASFIVVRGGRSGGKVARRVRKLGRRVL